MTKSTATPTRAEIEKRRRTAKKAAAAIGGTVERDGDDFRVVPLRPRPGETAEETVGRVIEAVRELPATDAPVADGQALAATLRERIAAAIDGAELVATPTGIEHRVRLGGRTLAYVTPQKRSVRVHLTAADGKPVVKVAAEEEMDAAIAAIDDLARATG